MEVKERLLREIDTLNPRGIMKVYDLVLTLKKKEKAHPNKGTDCGHISARYALKHCVGSLSDDIVEGRGVK